VKSFSPARSGLDTAASRNRAGADATVKAVLDQGLGNIDPASVTLMVDGAAVTPTVNKVGSEVTVTYKPASFANGSHTVALTFGDRTINWTFGVGLPSTPTFWIEASDYNYDSGQTRPEASVMPYFGGAYAGLAGVIDVDYHPGGEPSNPFYRYPNTQGTPMSWANDRDRGAGEVVTNFRIGWGGGGQWWNYTRTFPNGKYNVYAALCHADPATSATRIGGRLEDVTGGTTTVLGVFHAPGTGGWGNNALVPLQDAATTNTVVALDLSGTKTWRFNLANGDYDYLLLAPALETAPEFTGVTKNTDGTITVTWTGGGTLEVTPSLSPVDWQPVAGAVSPYTFTPQAGVNTLFGRIRQ
jgi:hypothetical protein